MPLRLMNLSRSRSRSRSRRDVQRQRQRTESDLGPHVTLSERVREGSEVDSREQCDPNPVGTFRLGRRTPSLKVTGLGGMGP